MFVRSEIAANDTDKSRHLPPASDILSIWEKKNQTTPSEPT